MIGEERETRHKYELNMVEYLASFWNAEAVNKIKNSRDSREDPRFASDAEFEKQIVGDDFLNDDIIKRIKDKYKHTNIKGDIGDDHRGARDIRLPSDLSNLTNIIKGKID